MTKAARLAIALLILTASTSITPAVAAACPLTYATFEVAIPHIDLETCPDVFDNEAIFCRATIGSDQVHIFAFSTDGDNCLLSVVSFNEGEFSLDLKKK